MKRFLLATVALAALSAPAAAADLATKYPVKAVAVPVFSWTGFYIGANFGYGGGTPSTDWTSAAGDYYGYDLDSSGFFAGGQIGYNYQFANNVVVGLETDLQWADIDGSYSDSYGAFGSKIQYFGTIRARLGYAFDRFLPYITGGAAYGQLKVYENDVDFNYSQSNTKWGWTLGGGAEYAITNNWTFKAEYLYVDLGSTDITVTDGVDTWFGSSDAKFHTVKAGVNYKF